jgi:hypothetical protein
MKMKILLSLSLFLFCVVGSIYGQPVAIKTNIEFPFTVAGMVLPAGAYHFERNEAATAFRVQGEGKNGVNVMIVTRLGGEIHTTPQDTHLVFDKVGDTYLLSEIWIPGEDGYLLLATKGRHEHKTLNVNN